MVIIVITSSWGASGETCKPWKWRFDMFVQGPSTQCSLECVDIALVYVTRISSPGVARITGGSSRPLNENAALPVSGSLIAFKETGERVSGGSDTRIDFQTV